MLHGKLLDRFLFTPINKGLVHNQPGLHLLTDEHEFFHLCMFNHCSSGTVRVGQHKDFRAYGRQGFGYTVETQRKGGRAKKEVCDCRPSRAKCGFMFAEERSDEKNATRWKCT